MNSHMITYLLTTNNLLAERKWLSQIETEKKNTLPSLHAYFVTVCGLADFTYVAASC
jgi:hypothetical protein